MKTIIDTKKNRIIRFEQKTHKQIVSYRNWICKQASNVLEYYPSCLPGGPISALANVLCRAGKPVGAAQVDKRLGAKKNINFKMALLLRRWSENLQNVLKTK